MIEPPTEGYWGPTMTVTVVVTPTGPEAARVWYSLDPPDTPAAVAAHDLRTVADIMESGVSSGVTSTGVIVTEVGE